VEQQLAAGLAEREIAQFVDDDEIVAQQGGLIRDGVLLALLPAQPLLPGSVPP
jgi:hypothetical protein